MSENKRQFKHEAKKDKYTKARGGTSQFYYLFCATCGEFLALYQKDGPGNLLRLYLDRIFEPEQLASLQNKTSKGDIPTLACQKCKTQIGFPMVYARENRLAFRLIHGSFRKEKCNGSHYAKN